MIAETTLPDAATIAEEAYVLAYPLVLTGRTMPAAANSLAHARDTPDTLRSWGWLDLAAEPIVLSVPDTCGRYYVLCLRDAWSSVFASVGARTTGTAAGDYAVLGPGQHDARLPPGVTPIAAPTRAVRLAGCLEAVHERDEEAL